MPAGSSCFTMDTLFLETVENKEQAIAHKCNVWARSCEVCQQIGSGRGVCQTTSISAQRNSPIHLLLLLLLLYVSISSMGVGERERGKQKCMKLTKLLYDRALKFRCEGLCLNFTHTNKQTNTHTQTLSSSSCSYDIQYCITI